MPWYAQREGLPDTHKMWADPGSQHEQVLQHLGMVEVPAPGADQTDEPPVGEPPVDPPVTEAVEVVEVVDEPAGAKPRGKAR